jgi:uncharacterized membrane protein
MARWLDAAAFRLHIPELLRTRFKHVKARFRTLWEQLHTSFWFVPGLMIAGAVALSALTLWIDGQVDQERVNAMPLVFHDGVEGARSLLASVVTSMITVTGVTFSVTIVAFTLASSQFSPRLLRNFMRDTGNQMVLGAFIATFSFCLLVLRVVGGPTGDFIPRVSVTTALVLTAATVGALVYFIHHASALIQAQAIVARTGKELEHALEQLYPEEAGESPPHKESEQLPRDFAKQAAEVRATRSDYIEAVDAEELIALAEEKDLLIVIERRPGDFIGEEEVITRVSPAERATAELQQCVRNSLILGPERTQTQDPEFVLNELVEIAVRALSPSINDPATACLCVDRLGAALAKIAARPVPSAFRYDRAGNLRLVAKHHAFEGLANAAFNQIRQYGRKSVPITVRLLEAIRRVASRVQRDEDRATLLQHAEMIMRGSEKADFDSNDRADIEERYRLVVAALSRE